MSEVAFVERQCQIGGARCPAWNAWFVASDEADPTAIEQERDPTPLAAFAFDPNDCGCPSTCQLYARAT